MADAIGYAYLQLAVTAGLTLFGGVVAILFEYVFIKLAWKPTWNGGRTVSLFPVALFFAGALGGVINNYHRVALLVGSPDRDALIQMVSSPAFAVQLWVSVLMAGVLGIVAHVIIMSGLVKGPLFPRPSDGLMKGPFESLATLQLAIRPGTNADAVKAVVWVFLAGFSERFVPNMLDGLVPH